MPVYEYVCSHCSRTFEELVFPGDPQPVCPSCDTPEVERVLSGFAVGASSGSGAAACATKYGGGGGACGGGGCGGCPCN